MHWAGEELLLSFFRATNAVNLLLQCHLLCGILFWNFIAVSEDISSLLRKLRQGLANLIVGCVICLFLLHFLDTLFLSPFWIQHLNSHVLVHVSFDNLLGQRINEDRSCVPLGCRLPIFDNLHCS